MSTAGDLTTAQAALRVARRDRVLDAMVAAGLDALVLSRRDAVAYATGARGLWTAGTRPFGAACVLVAAERSVHLLSTWDEGVPAEIPFERLYGVTWNPAVMADSLRAIPGLTGARRIGVDGLSVGFERAARRLAPSAEVVPADDILRDVRAVKLPAEVGRLRAATSVAAVALDAATGALAGGVAPTRALAEALWAAAERGVTTPASAPVVAPVDASGSLVHVDIGLLADGYEGGRGRTVSVGSGVGPRAATEAAARIAAVDAAQRRLLDACGHGAEAGDLRTAAAGTTDWRVRGTGMGFEHPVVTTSLGGDVTLAEGMALSVEVDLDGVRRRDLVLVGSGSPAIL
jgi:Xaa-Pro dipeptidase